MLNPVWLDTFLTLADTGNFTRTAEKRFMTQPGVSQHLKKLEEACGCELVVRLGKGIQLTEQGRRVYDYALQQKKREQDFLSALKFDEKYEGQCSVACSGATAQRIYPALIALQVKYPKLNIHVEVAPRRTILQGIQSNSMLLGIVTNMPNSDDVAYNYLGEETLGLILPKKYEHKYHQIDSLLPTLGLINHPDALHYLQRYINDSGDDKLQRINPNKMKHTGYINQLSQILLPVSQGLGFTVLPTSTLTFSGVANLLCIYKPTNSVTEPLYSVQTPHTELPARYELIKSTVAEVLCEAS